MANFTPQEIEEILQAFFNMTGRRQYVGARYVPIFGRSGEDSIEWDNSGAYEPLTIVYHNGDTYTSRRYVPAGIDISDTGYWVITGRYNAQIEQYRQEVVTLGTIVDSNSEAIDDINNMLPSDSFSSDSTVKDYVDAKEAEIREGLDDTYLPFPDGYTWPKFGTANQVLATLANGDTKWVDPLIPTDEQANTYITQWLNNHPEATTTVLDGSITDAKLNSNSTIFLSKGSVTGISSISDVKKAGTYVISSAVFATLDDIPDDATSNATYVLFNIVYSSSNGGSTQYPYQILFDSSSPNIWYRWIKASATSDWVRITPIDVHDSVINNNSTISFWHGSVTDATTLASVSKSGSYFISSSVFGNMTDKPSDAVTSEAHTLFNIPFSTANNGATQYSYQLLFSSPSRKIWYRWLTSTTPTSWVRIYPAADIADDSISTNSTIQHYRGAASSIAALSDLTKAGTYFIDAETAATLSDLPSDASSSSAKTLVNITYASRNQGATQYPYQILFDASEAKIWYRWIKSSSTSAWQRVFPQEMIEDSVSVLTHKKLVTAGDSFTSASFGPSNEYTGKNYGYYIAQRNSMTFVNAGISGSTMALDKTYVDDPTNVDINTRQPFSYQRYQQIPADTDYLVLWFGINDETHTYLGTIDDTTNETFYGAWNMVLEYYLTNRPFMHIGIVITVRSNDNYRNAVRQVAAKWGYPIIDLVNGTDSPAFFERQNMSSAAQALRRNAYGYNTWNAHPNPQWHEFISGSFEEFLKRC